jgi:exodeoxyribonuclease VII large subunit
MISPTEKNILSISQLNRKAKQLLETHLPLIWVSGEMSNLAQPASGHWYFSLKDERAQVRCAMFKNANLRLRWQPKSGMHIIARARVSLYEGRGEYQLIIEHMEEAGVGALQQQYEALKRKLHEEGLFDETQKKELPLFPKHIGVITSATGAAIHDILTVLKRRYPIAAVTVIPVSVQGETAAPEMITALKKAKRFKLFDVLIIGRGGGSIEDLWAFNNEALAREIAACPIPIISAVGHEVDFTICDFVSDVRAPTPSASAEIATPDLEEWQQYIDNLQLQLGKALLLYLKQKRQVLLQLRKQLRHPGQQVKFQQHQIQVLQRDLIRSMRSLTMEINNSLQEKMIRLKHQHPKQHLALRREQLQRHYHDLKQSTLLRLEQLKQQLSASSTLLNAVSPLAVLGRGYSIVTQEDGTNIHSINQLTAEETVLTKLCDGHFKSKVLSFEKAKNSD